MDFIMRQAKRYLVWREPAYHHHLSEASKGPLLPHTNKLIKTKS